MSKSQAFCKLIIFPPQHPSPALSLSHTHTHSLLLSVGEGDFSQTDRGERQHSFTDGSSGIRWNLYKTDFDYMPKHLHVCVSVCAEELVSACLHTTSVLFKRILLFFTMYVCVNDEIRKGEWKEEYERARTGGATRGSIRRVFREDEDEKCTE